MKTLGKILLTLFFVLSILLAPTFRDSLAENERPTESVAVCISVTTDSCIIRESPDPDSVILARGENGQVFQVIARFGQMIGVQLNAYQIGYIPLKDVQLAESGETPDLLTPLTPSYTPITLVGSDNSDNNVFALGASIASLSNISEGQTEAEALMEPHQPSTGLEQEPSNHETQATDTVPIDQVPDEPETEDSIPPTGSNPDQTIEDTPVEVQTGTGTEADSDVDGSLPEPEPEPESTAPEIITDEADETDESDTVQSVTVQAPSLTSSENIMYQLICKLRATKGLNPLALDTALIDVARIKTRELIDLDYFSHTSPVYGSPQDMLRHFSISFSYMGENIGLNTNAEEAYKAFINSPLHLDNILNPDFTHIGIGIADKKSDQVIVTLIFIKSSE